MTTKFIDLEKSEESIKKPTEFIKVIELDGNFLDADLQPSFYKNVELLRKTSLGTKYDLMRAWNVDRDNAVYYLGHWNDGCL